MDWEAKEQRADEEERLGRYVEFDSVTKLIADLHAPDILTCPQCGLVYYPESATDIHCIGNGDVK